MLFKWILYLFSSFVVCILWWLWGHIIYSLKTHVLSYLLPQTFYTRKTYIISTSCFTLSFSNYKFYCCLLFLGFLRYLIQEKYFFLGDMFCSKFIILFFEVISLFLVTSFLHILTYLNIKIHTLTILYKNSYFNINYNFILCFNIHKTDTIVKIINPITNI